LHYNPVLLFSNVQVRESNWYKKLSCRREAARCFVSLNISL